MKVRPSHAPDRQRPVADSLGHKPPSRGRRSGAALLVRDVTEVRRREQVLLNKDATIREVHHRVKNNLQTVSALLRMQARRASNEETRQALSEAERRVTTIATVHDALSHNVNERVDFDDVFSSVLRMAAVVASPTGQVSTVLEGSFGVVDADTAQALATVLAELVTHAISAQQRGHSCEEIISIINPTQQSTEEQDT